MFFSTWLGFYDFEFFLCSWVTWPGVPVLLGTEATDESTAEVLIADC